MVKIIIETVRMKLSGLDEGIGSLLKELEEPVESVELRMNILTQPKYAKEKGAEAVDTFKKYTEVCDPISSLSSARKWAGLWAPTELKINLSIQRRRCDLQQGKNFIPLF